VAGRRLGAEDAVTPLGDIQVDLEDPALVPQRFIM